MLNNYESRRKKLKIALVCLVAFAIIGIMCLSFGITQYKSVNAHNNDIDGRYKEARLFANFTKINYTAQIVSGDCPIVVNVTQVSALPPCSSLNNDDIVVMLCTKQGGCSNNVCKTAQYRCGPSYGCDDLPLFYNCCAGTMQDGGCKYDGYSGSPSWMCERATYCQCPADTCAGFTCTKISYNYQYDCHCMSHYTLLCSVTYHEAVHLIMTASFHTVHDEVVVAKINQRDCLYEAGGDCIQNAIAAIQITETTVWWDSNAPTSSPAFVFNNKDSLYMTNGKATTLIQVGIFFCVAATLIPCFIGKWMK